MRKITRIKNLLLGLLMIVFALVLFLEPTYGPPVILTILGIALIIEGIRTLVFYLTMARHMVDGKKTFYRGILILDLGVLLLAGYQGSERLALLYMLTLFAVAGVINLIRAFESVKQGAPWKYRMLSGLIALAILFAGLAMKRNPNTMVYIFCIGLLYLGITSIASVFRKTAVIYIPQ